ncbi:MAG TPA: ribbon-helix-helix domain-containing protein [Terriglobia bacterium]|nr:ribbon-helix-helix domain-containing protein [Terriglobia bacterium]
MSTTKVAVTLQKDTLQELDRWVKEGQYPNRSRAIQTAIVEMAVRRRRRRLIEELTKIDPKQERALADATFSGETPWPEY